MGKQSERNSGFTLVEVSFAVVAMVILLGGGYALVGSVSSSSGEILTNFEDLRGSVEEANRFRTDLARARVTEVNADGSSITYSVPVRNVNDSVLNEDGTLNWGIQDKTGSHPGGWATVQFVPQKELSEAKLLIDINRDGDKSDVFEVGRLKITTNNGVPIDYRGRPIIRLKGIPDGDIDGDGQADPMFKLMPNGVVRMRVFSPRPEGGLKLHVSKFNSIEIPGEEN